MRLLFWRRPTVPVLELHGLIATRPGTLSAASVGPLIERAVAAAARVGTLVLDIESPGGSPVQSDLIATRIRRRAEEKGVRVVAVIGEVGASGGYWLACAGDEILANAMSVVGSIGVIGGGFGLQGLIGRFGVERRLYTAGENKARLDPFSPERPQDVAFVRALLDDLHARFKDWVRTRRAGKLRGEEGAIFDGGWMLGARALELGLVDRLGDLDALVREIGGAKARARVFRPRRRFLLARLPRMVVEEVLDAVEARVGVRS
ncbi:MAG: S49 family peptidase [Alphaproteobacteria bacterium]|nr:S49 family peptidase [Alphaproteobacteria bacterium]